MTKKIFANVNFDKENKRLTIAVYTDFLDKLREILSSDRPIGKAFSNISKVYVLLYWINSFKQYHIDKEDLATMAYARHRESLNKAIERLKEHKLLETELKTNVSKSRSYYTYRIHKIKYERKTDSTTLYEFEIPEVSFWNLIYSSNNSIAILNYPSSFPPHIYRTDSQRTEDFDSFLCTFTGWYEELDIGDLVTTKGYFSEKDGRFYHRFNTMHKEERLSSVKLDGENLVEVWDAHSAFFIVLGYYLKYIVSYQSEEDRIVVTKEADKMLSLATSDQFYISIMRYHNQHAQWLINRNKAKELVQKYINKTYTRLFNKNGMRTKYPDSLQCQYVDEFFQASFPCIRTWLLNYPRHDETKDIEICREKGKSIIRNQKVSISNIYRDIMPYEFKLISMGLCKDLYFIYGVKSLTVHDAIYVRVSDTATINSDIIDNLLASRLGLPLKTETILRSKKLF